MATSGTVGTTVVNVAGLIEMAYRKCGVETGKITAEATLSAKLNLYAYLSNLANRGVNLWCIERTLCNLNLNSPFITLPNGTIDTLQVLYRTMTRYNTGSGASSAGGDATFAFDGDVDTICTQISSNGNISFANSSNVMISTVGVLPGADSVYDLVFEVSQDNVTWLEVQAFGEQAMVDNQWFWVDITVPVTAPYARIRETGGATLSTREVYFGGNPNEIMMARISLDQYSNLPNKYFPGTPTQYYLDRQRLQPIINMYPVPTTVFALVSVWRHRMIQDVGALTDEIEVPQRWFQAIMYNLSLMLEEEKEQIDLNRQQALQLRADRASREAEMEERDKSPVMFAPNIRPYTA